MQTLTTKPITFYKKAVACASHYGFVCPIEIIEQQGKLDEAAFAAANEEEQEQLLAAKARSKVEKPLQSILEQRHKKIDGISREFEAALKHLGSKQLSPHTRPLLFYTSNIDPEALKDGAELPKTINFSLHAVGIRQSIAEALILKTALTILDDLGETNTYVQLNSLGDRDSSAKFVRDATAHMRKHLNELPPQAQQAFKEDVFLGYNYVCKKNIELPEELPRPMEFLSSASRKHFREVLEFLEAADIPYIFDDTLLGHRDCYTQTLFSIKGGQQDGFGEQDDEHHMYARGGRFDELARRYFKKPTPAVGISFSFKPEGNAKNEPIPVTKTNRRPQVFFIQLGYAAQLKGFAIIESLRKARVPIEQSHESQRLSDQLAYAESLSIPYTIIMGQKEALEGNVIVRDTASRAQQTVAVEMLPMFFKK